MKKLIVSISLCALLLCGCQVVLAPGAYDLHSDGLTKAEALHIVPAGSSEVTQVLDDPAELDAFSRILNDAVETDDWAMSSLPHGAVPLGTITYTQAETLKLGQRPEERQMEETERIVDLYRERLLGGVTALPRESDAAEWKFLSRKNRLLFQLMSCWMALKQEGVELKDFLQEKGYHSIAIYGMGNLGNILLRELEGSSIRVDYLIDRNAKNLCTALPIYRTTDALPPVGVVIVTAPLSFYEIRKALAQKVACPVVSLEDLLYEMRDGASRLGKAETEGRA